VCMLGLGGRHAIWDPYVGRESESEVAYVI
jgi:hypothetical protein